jgi:CSLREA domain-containing protein
MRPNESCFRPVHRVFRFCRGVAFLVAFPAVLFGAELASVNAPAGASGGEDVFEARACTGFLVDTTADTHLANPADLNCVDPTGKCSLRAAVEASNNAPGPNVICLPAGTYMVTDNSDIVMTDGVTIDGEGTATTIVDRGFLGRVFDVNARVTNVVIQNIQINNGFVRGDGGGLRVGANASVNLNFVDFNGNQVIGNGGGLAVVAAGDAALLTCNFKNNTASGEGGALSNAGTVQWDVGSLSTNSANTGGGGIVNTGVFSGTHLAIGGNTAPTRGTGIVGLDGAADVVNSAGPPRRSGDRAVPLTPQSSAGRSPSQGLRLDFAHQMGTFGSGIISGGGIYNDVGGTLNLGQSEISANDAASGSGMYNPGTATLTNVTVSGNTNFGNPGLGITTGISGLTHLSFATIANNSSATLGIELEFLGRAGFGFQVQNSIVAGGGGGAQNCTRGVQSLGDNIDNGSTCAFAAIGDMSSTNPLIGPLQFNGGLTKTHNLLGGSPAIDAATSGCPGAFTDQRDVARPQGPACDIGAVEVIGLSISDASVIEGNSGQTSALFTVTLTSATSGTGIVTVDYATADGTATVSDNDYQATSGTLTFTAGQTTQTISVPVNGDTKVEPDETFFVNLTNPVNVRISDGQGIGTIVNDDSITIADLSLALADAPDPVSKSSALAYTLAVSNLGPSTASSVSVTDTLPAGVTFQSAGGSGWACGFASGIVTCTLPSLAVGPAPVITIVVTAPATAGTISDSASVTSTTTDPVAGNNSQTVSTTVVNCQRPPAITDLSLSPLNIDSGAPFTLTWTATMPAGAGQYEILLSYDSGATFHSLGFTPNTIFTSTVFNGPGAVLEFEVIAEPPCGSGVFLFSPPSNVVTLTIGASGACPKAVAPTATVSGSLIAVGDPFTLTWNATLAAGTGQYTVLQSTDGGATFVPIGSTPTTTFTGTAPSVPVGRLIFLAVRAEPSCSSGSTSFSSPGPAAFYTAAASCATPGAVTNLQIHSVGSVTSPPSPTDFIAVSWDAPATGAVPTGYAIRLNGDTESSSTGTSAILPPRGTRTDPITLFVRALACTPEKSGPTAQSDPVALLLTPPVADFSPSPNARVGTPVVFTDTSSPQATSWLWVFDDGATDTRQSPSHSFTTAGGHTASLIASNGAGSSTKSETFTVSASTSTSLEERAIVISAVALDESNPVRRRGRVHLSAPGSTWLRVRSQEAGNTVLFLRFLDGSGALVQERSLTIGAGEESMNDLAAWGLTGDWTIELVGAQKFEAAILEARRPSPREVRR